MAGPDRSQANARKSVKFENLKKMNKTLRARRKRQPRLLHAKKEGMESKTFPKASSKTPALKRSMMNVLNTSFQTKKAMDRMWYVAPTCPLFLKKAKKLDAAQKQAGKKRKKFRVNRILSSHTIKALASGAAAHAAKLQGVQASNLRCDVNDENLKYPLMPSIGKSASMLLEQAIAAYCQEAFLNAVQLKQAIKKHVKVTVKAQQAGVDALNERINDATAFMPSMCIPRLPPPQKARKAKPVNAVEEPVPEA